ncbi:hypothetical protein C1752_03755 [Acaryochloris thomasi RCC1774]|uniref:Uncharacterized protein n=1 Tax=Acaryochloris thomasi RCC1774 TaxID=1764569 RepID=A0A2W1JEL8_9CYAN|nr:hypothetical protein [Acaryochloris thomasi]PZD72169.1 hypothetical protein C1752_03755 [Acaryochloris thomasi RCC1774]
MVSQGSLATPTDMVEIQKQVEQAGRRFLFLKADVRDLSALHALQAAVAQTVQLLGSLGAGSSFITNLAFGSPDLNTLYIYAANGNSLNEVERRSRIVRLTLNAVRGLRLTQ